MIGLCLCLSFRDYVTLFTMVINTLNTMKANRIKLGFCYIFTGRSDTRFTLEIIQRFLNL